MCFRPSGTAQIIKCIECGSFNKPDNEVCQKCGTDLTASKEAAAAQMSSGNAPGIQSPSAAPAAQSGNAPGAPKAPGAPGAPKAPRE